MDSIQNQERHWQDDDLLRNLYGLALESGASEEHLLACGECSRRWESLRLARAEYLSEAAVGLVPEQRLLKQRQAVWARIEHPGRFWLSKWAPLTATSMMLAVGLMLFHPARPLASEVARATGSHSAVPISDAELFSDLSAMASSGVPRAADPIRGLFEPSSSQEEGSY